MAVGANGKNGNAIGTNGTNVTNYWENPEHTLYKSEAELQTRTLRNIDYGYMLEWRGFSNEYPQSMFLSKNKKNRYTPAYPSFAI